MNILFIIDPLSQLHRETDTTLAIMDEANQRKHSVWIAEVSDLRLEGKTPWGRLTRFKKVAQPRLGINEVASLRLGLACDIPLEQIPIIFMRKDPPFTIDYAMTTSLLSLVNPQKSFIINKPTALRNFNEKLGIFQFSQFIPPSMVTKKYEDVIAFLKKHKKIVLKPLEGYGGEEIIVLDHRDKNRNALLEMLTRHETRFIMAQKYLPAVKHGDKRVLILDGKILGQQNRVAPQDDHRSNISTGGKSYKTRLTLREKKICEVVGKALREQGIYFAGIDLIGGLITEINVTSPTGLVKMNEHEGTRLERKVVDWMEEKISKYPISNYQIMTHVK